MLSILSQRERDVVELRFGIGASHNHSLEEIGKKFNLSRERIRQIVEAALRKLKNSNSRNELKDFAVLN
jgi:RNA polymerase primary sigma factor